MGFVQSLFGSSTGSGFNAYGVNNSQNQGAATQVGNTQQSQNALLSALQQYGGAGNQQSAVTGQEGVAQGYQNLANGVGPNPAQAQLAQNTAANVAQTGALMAGQRGASQNTGLIARQAGQQGAATQQQSASNAATLGAQQQLQGLQGLGSTYQNIAGIGANQVGQQLSASQQAAATALGNQSNIYGLQGNINTTNAGIAAGNQKAQAGLVGGIFGGIGAGSGSVGGSAQNSARGGMIGYTDGGAVVQPGSAASQPAPVGPQSYIGKYFSGPSGGGMNQDTGKSGNSSGAGLYQIGKLAYQGGKSLYNALKPSAVDASATDTTAGGTSTVAGGQGEAAATGAADTAGADAAAEGATEVAATDSGATDALLALAADGGEVQAGYKDTEPDPTTIGGTLESVMSYLYRGGKVDAMVSKGEQVIPPEKVAAVAQGKANPLKTGERIPGKPQYPGNDYRNDVVPKKLAKGSIVVPNEKMQSKNPEQAAANFVSAVLAKKGKMK